MRTVLTSILLFLLPAILFSKTIDCSQAPEGIVTIVAKSEKITHIDAVREAMVCFSQSNEIVKSAIANAVALAKFEDDKLCGTLDDAKALEISSWKSTTPDNLGELGLDSTVLISQGVSCTEVGGSRFEGIASNAMFLFKVVEAAKITDWDPIKKDQKITVTLIKIVQL